MNILFVCTSNKDRSPALEQYFKEKYPNNEYKSAGVNRYFTSKKETHYLTIEDIAWAELIVFAEDIHHTIVHRDFKESRIGWRCSITLNLGEYKQGQIEKSYLLSAENKLRNYIVNKIVN